MMEYFSKFGLEYDPFLKNSKDKFVRTPEAREVLCRLEYLQNVKGFGLLTGEPGLGKTTCIRNWCGSLNPSLFKVVYSSLSTLTVQEFYMNLARSLGTEPAYRKTENFHRIQAEINRYALEKRITPVIVIDEANYINSKVLNDLKMLFNFEMDSRDRAVVLLSGLQQLNNTLNLSVHEPLRQRIVMNYNMEALSKTDAREYLLAKLVSAGRTDSIYEDAALEAVLNSAQGKPRLINKYSTCCMRIAASLNEQLISTDTAMKAISECELN